jgi:hypothetical protein
MEDWRGSEREFGRDEGEKKEWYCRAYSRGDEGLKRRGRGERIK